MNIYCLSRLFFYFTNSPSEQSLYSFTIKLLENMFYIWCFDWLHVDSSPPINLVCAPPPPPPWSNERALMEFSHHLLTTNLHGLFLSIHFLIPSISCCFSPLPVVWKSHPFWEESRLIWRDPSAHLFLRPLLGSLEKKLKFSSVTLKGLHTLFPPRDCHGNIWVSKDPIWNWKGAKYH